MRILKDNSKNNNSQKQGEHIVDEFKRNSICELKFAVISQQNEIVGNDSLLFNISEIQRSIERYNDYQTIINEEVFGPLANDSVIIVVQVHKRITYLRHLIVSLAQARDISKALLIFSHDFYDDEIIQLVQSIDFCKVMQIFYPFSIQTHPHEFPGTDPRDCKRDMKKEQALIAKCQNALYGEFDGIVIYGNMAFN